MSNFIKKIGEKIVRRIQHYRLILLARNLTYHNLGKVQIKNILVLCYGNIYRSPFVAEYLTRTVGSVKYCIRSAGFYPKSDRPPPQRHIHMSKRFGVDLSDHRSSIVSRELVDWADVVVIMDRFNWDKLVQYDESVLKKTIWLGTFSGRIIPEIEDPYDKSEKEAESILQLMKLSCDNFAKFLRGKKSMLK